MAATPKRGLGKGLGALIPTESATNAPRPEAAQPTAMPSGGSAAATVAATYAELPLDAITPNPRQPRTVFDDEALAELNPTVALGPSLGDLTPQPANAGFFRRATQTPPEALVHANGKVARTALGRLGSENVQEGAFRFAGVDDLYFMAAVIGQARTRAVYRPVTVPVDADTQRQFVAASFRFDRSPNKARFFIGPKQFDLLQRIDSELVRAVNFGIFGWLAVPLLGGLKWLHGFTGNWGWSIVLLTVLINLAIFPLRHKSVVSMRRMQEIQPQLKAIQDRYAGLKVTDPARQKMNEEIMALYRQKGANPASAILADGGKARSFTQFTQLSLDMVHPGSYSMKVGPVTVAGALTPVPGWSANSALASTV